MSTQKTDEDTKSAKKVNHRLSTLPVHAGRPVQHHPSPHLTLSTGLPPYPGGHVIGCGGPGYLGAQNYLETGSVDAAIEKIKPLFEKRTGVEYEAIKTFECRSQTVTAQYFFVKAMAKPVDGEEQIVHLKIHRDSNGNHSLMDFQLGKTLADKMEYTAYF